MAFFGSFLRQGKKEQVRIERCLQNKDAVNIASKKRTFIFNKPGMKKEDVPQDLSSLGKITKEVCYATDGNGKYVTELSKGWDVKITALDAAWQDIEGRIAVAKQKVLSKEASPLLFFMERGLMDVAIVAAYTGFFKWQIKRHLAPAVFDKLPYKKLQRYAEVFNVSVEDLKNMNVHEH